MHVCIYKSEMSALARLWKVKKPYMAALETAISKHVRVKLARRKRRRYKKVAQE